MMDHAPKTWKFGGRPGRDGQDFIKSRHLDTDLFVLGVLEWLSLPKTILEHLAWLLTGKPAYFNSITKLITFINIYWQD
jgi:hypothetical protein